jgi:SAM-dependent methyltransferase
MAMTSFEKRFVNRQKKGGRNIGRIRDLFAQIDLSNIRDVLEIGCGVGAVSAYLAREYQMRVIGTDLDPEQIDIARMSHPEDGHLHYRVENAASLSFEDNAFDLIISQNVFHHIPAWENAIREAERVLRPDGYFIWYDLAFPGFITQLLKPFVSQYGLYTVDDIQFAFDQIGFTQRLYQRSIHGPFIHHQLLMQNGSPPF